MRFSRKAVLGAVVALGFMLPAVAAERAIIVLDGSGSMWAQVEGEARITIARDTLAAVLGELPDTLELGFMTYGHREKGNCADIEMLVEPGPANGAAIAAAAADINPKGMTPLGDAVRLAAEELRFTEEKATVILITDGLETCEVDPCALGDALESQGVDFTAHVLGFGLSDEEGRQVACLAENTGGQYLSARDGAELVAALSTTVSEVAQAEPEPEPEPAALDINFTVEVAMVEGGELLTDTTGGGLYWELTHGGELVDYGYGIPQELVEPGDYDVTVRLGEVELSQKVTIRAEELAAPHFILDAGTVVIRAFAAEGDETVTDGAAIGIVYPGGDSYGYGEASFIVPAGEIVVSAEIGEGTVSESFTLGAGETIEKDLVAGVGVAVINGSYVDGMAVDEDGMAVVIFKAAEDMNGSREEVSYGYGPGGEYQLVPGDYVALIRMDQASVEVPFTVGSGERVAVDGLLDAGVAALSMPGADGFNIYEAARDIQGNRQEISYGYGQDHQATLPAGDYVVVTRYADDSQAETGFTVTAGERVEVLAERASAKSKSK